MTAYPHIKDDLSRTDSVNWYYRWYIIVPALIFTGPLALILVWARPGTNLYLKLIISLIVAVLTAMITFDTVNYYRHMAGYYSELGEEHNDLSEKKGGE